MTLGEKIKKYRILKNLTQKELGLKIGFSAATADSRIRKYEKDIMAPKEDIRNKLLDALDVDSEAINNIDISSPADIMHFFFELEEMFGMNIEKKDGKTVLSFDDSNKDISSLISYLNLWQNKKALLLDSDNIATEKKHEYSLWKSRFIKNVNEYYQNKKDEIDNLYAPQIKDLEKSYPHAKKTSEITLLFKEIINSGFHVSTISKTWNDGRHIIGFTFSVNELLHPENNKQSSLFTNFLFEFNHWFQLGANCFTDFQITDKSLTVSYCVPIPTFSVITMQINEFLAFKENQELQTDFSVDSFETKFKHNLEMFYNIIEDEIKHYSE